MSIILAIDPGPAQSAWLYHGMDELDFGISENEKLLDCLRKGSDYRIDRVVIENVESFGMAVGKEVFATVFWSGRFAEAVQPVPVMLIGRKAVKIALCGSMRAKDANIRAALIDRYGGASAIGKKASPGPLYGIHADVWSALAVAVTYTDGAR